MHREMAQLRELDGETLQALLEASDRGLDGLNNTEWTLLSKAGLVEAGNLWSPSGHVLKDLVASKKAGAGWEPGTLHQMEREHGRI